MSLFSRFTKSKSPSQPSPPSQPSQQPQQQQPIDPNNEYSVLYHTFSLCPICSFVKQQGFQKEQWKPSQVVTHRGQVYQRIECTDHGIQTILLCSNAAFFDRCMTFTPAVLEQKKKKSSTSSSGSSSSSGGAPLLDIEDLEQRLTHNPEISGIVNTPFMVDCNLYVNGGSSTDNNSNNGYFVPDDVLKQQLSDICTFFPKDKNFVLKLNAQLVPMKQMHILNERVSQVLNMSDDRISQQPIVLECTFDRLSRLSKLEDTVLLNSRIYPSVQLYVEKGRESHNTDELRYAYENLKTIQNLQVIVRLVVSKPLPDLKLLLELLRFEMIGFTRFVIIEMERTPSQLMKHFKAPDPSIENRFEHVHLQSDFSYSVDPLELLHNIQQATDGQVAISDFYPASTGMILEPFLRMLGKGNYNIRPSPFCGFAAMLINTEEQFKSVPISRIFNIENLYRQMVPLVKKLEKGDGTLNLFTGHALKKAINQSIIPKKYRMDNFEIPSDFVSFLISEDKQSETTELMDKLQFIIIHNKMDVCSIDMTKRSRCTLCSHVNQTGSENGKLVAQCTRIL